MDVQASAVGVDDFHARTSGTGSQLAGDLHHQEFPLRAPNIVGRQSVLPAGRQYQIAHTGSRHQKLTRTLAPAGAIPIFILHGARANEHLSFGTGS
jgi:hypothetical protein